MEGGKKVKKTVSFGDIWFLAVSVGKHLQESKGQADLKEVYKVCSYLDDAVAEKSFEAFKSSYYRARRSYGKVTLIVTD